MKRKINKEKISSIRRMRFRFPAYVLVRCTLIPFLKYRYKVTAENKEVVRSIKGPFIIVANHVTYFDPVFVHTFVWRRIHFLTSKTMLRKPIMRWMLTRVGVIPKSKADSRDMQAVRDMRSLISRNKVICFFPEGRQTWDSNSQTFPPSTAKLLKLFDVPVVSAHIRGGYLARPRWSKVRRQFPVNVKYNLMFSQEEIRNLDADEIVEVFNKKFYYSEYDYQKAIGKIALSDKGAEYFEALMYTCPQCKKFISLQSEGNTTSCTNCNYSATWDGAGSFIPNNLDLPSKVSDLLAWQRANFTELLKEKGKEFLTKVIFSDEVKVEYGLPMEVLKPYKESIFKAYSDRFTLGEADEEEVFSFEEIDTFHITLVNIIEFRKGEHVYRVTFGDNQRSGYKYLSLLQIIAPERAELV